MVNVAAERIHVGPRYEELSPTEKVEAMVSADGFEAFANGLPLKPPPDEGSFAFTLAQVALAVGILLVMFGVIRRDDSDNGLVAVGSGIVALSLIGLIFVRDSSQRHASEPINWVPVYVRSKDYVNRGGDTSSGAYSVCFVTISGDRFNSVVASDRADLLAIGDVGVAALHFGNLIDFKVLQVEPSDTDGDEGGESLPRSVGGWPVSPGYDPSDDRGAVV